MKEAKRLKNFKTKGLNFIFNTLNFYSEQLKNQSKNFLANAQELNKMMKKKGFFGW